jgi:hypothetical protein
LGERGIVDAFTPVPPLAVWGGTALILFGISVVTMIISPVVAVAGRCPSTCRRMSA